MTYLELRDALNQVPDEMLNGEIESGIIGKDEDGNRFSISITIKSIITAILNKDDSSDSSHLCLELGYKGFHYTPKE